MVSRLTIAVRSSSMRNIESKPFLNSLSPQRRSFLTSLRTFIKLRIFTYYFTYYFFKGVQPNASLAQCLQLPLTFRRLESHRFSLLNASGTLFCGFAFRESSSLRTFFTTKVLHLEVRRSVRRPSVCCNGVLPMEAFH